MKRLFFRSLIGLLLVFAAQPFFVKSVQAEQDFSLVGVWQIDYTLSGSDLKLTFEALPKSAPLGGQGHYIIPTGPLLIPEFLTPAVWMQITPELFSFSGEVEYLIGDFARETGTLTFKGSFNSEDSISGETIFITNQPDPENPVGFKTSVGKFSGKRIDIPVSDFALLINPPTITISRGQGGQITIFIDRRGGFAGNVTVIAPDAGILKALKIKLSPPSQVATGTSVTFNFKIKRSAPVGTQQLSFTGTDDSGRIRTAALTLLIQ